MHESMDKVLAQKKGRVSRCSLIHATNTPCYNGLNLEYYYPKQITTAFLQGEKRGRWAANAQSDPWIIAFQSRYCHLGILGNITLVLLHISPWDRSTWWKARSGTIPRRCCGISDLPHGNV